jgi:hypothetical protein
MFFNRPEIKKLQKHVKRPDDAGKLHANSRRAISLMPGPALRDATQEITVSDQSKFRQLLLSIEANQSSCCIKIVSPKHESRAAVLIFRGRVVGCIYGNKRLERQLFGQEAYSCVLADISHQSNAIDAYLLSEDLVLSAASLFNGEVFNADSTHSAEEIFEQAHRGLVHSGMPGCIVIKSGEETPAAIIYIFGGKIIGIFSSKEGWVSTSYEKALHYVLHTPGARVSASMLAASNIDEVLNLSFSLSGLSDHKAEEPKQLSEFELSYALVSNYDREQALRMTTNPTTNNPFMPKTKNTSLHNSRSIMNQ